MTKPILSAAAAAALTGALVASWTLLRAEPSHAEHGEPTLAFQVHTSPFFLLDFRADGVREIHSFQEPFEPSRGDQTIFRDELLDEDRKRVGFGSGFCTVTAVQLDEADPLKLSCQGSYELPEGQITTQGLATNNPVKRLAITGGTGRYAGAGGEATFTENGDGTASLVFRFTGRRR